MIVKIGDLFESKAKTLVNTINCVGVMGKGVALEFKKRYPSMFSEYVALCQSGYVKPGIPYYYQDLCGVSIINFPTKDHWRSPSKLSYIVSGLDWFRENYKKLNIESIAFPPLGCGNGGLPWTVVGPLMYSKLNDLPIEIEMYAPYGTPPEQITEKFLSQNLLESPAEITGNKNLKLNKYWLLILYVIKKLNNDKYSLSVGRTIFQKICYLLTRTGVPTGFKFVESQYGPYSSEAKQAVIVLSNANLMTEKRLGKMVETIVAPEFEIHEEDFSSQDIKNANQTFDLLSRIKSTDQAEMIATVLFSYDGLVNQYASVTEKQIFEHILSWKRHWKGVKEDEIISTIESLSILGWMKPDTTHDVLTAHDDWMF